MPIKSIDKIDETNDSIIDINYLPDRPKIEFEVFEKPYVKIDTSWWTKNIKDLVTKWKIKNKIEDDGETGYLYGLIRNKDHFYIKKIPYKIHYLFGEIGGGYKIEKCYVSGKTNIDKIIILFKDHIILPENQVKIGQIGPVVSQDFMHYQGPICNMLEKNIRTKFQYDSTLYEIDYVASLCTGEYEFNGMGTIYPVYFNIAVKLKNNDSGIEQVIYKIPDDSNYNIADIMYGVIDSDGELDIILSICNEYCRKQLVFLSSKKEDEALLKYMGETEVYCHDP